VEVRPFKTDDGPAVAELWRRCGLTTSWNDPYKDIQRKLCVQAHMFLVGLLDGQLVATVMAGYEGHRGWINYLAVAPEHRRRGYGRVMMGEAERLLRAAGCPKINLQIRTSNRSAIEFYRRLGFTIDDVLSMGKRLEHDEEPPGQSNSTC
jgi:ribosomal protein S18 acetylase RimI-like enzyme